MVASRQLIPSVGRQKRKGLGADEDALVQKKVLEESAGHELGELASLPALRLPRDSQGLGTRARS